MARPLGAECAKTNTYVEDAEPDHTATSMEIQTRQTSVASTTKGSGEKL